MMDIATLRTHIGAVVKQRNIFLFFSVVLLMSVILLALMLYGKKERIVIVPTVGPSLWIEESKVSDTYLEKLGLYLADLLLCRSPADVDRKNQIILEHVHPSYYHAAKKQLSQEREVITKSNQSLLFRPYRSYLDLVQQAYVVEGEMSVFVGKAGEAPVCVQTERKRFTFVFLCERGKLLLKSFKKEGLTDA